MKKLFLFVTALIAVNIAIAQKLPNIQETSLRAPKNVKVDGKATEWGDQFQANNNKTEIYYTIANDNEKLYLTVRATDETIIKKIVMGGVTFTVNTANKRDAKNAAAFTFPAYDSSNSYGFFKFSNSKIGTNADSLMNAHNKELLTRYKLIGIAGVNAITDSLLAIYNNEDIMASARFDNKLHYTYELAVPLKHLKVDAGGKFMYNIKLNPATIDGYKVEIITPRTNLNLVVYKDTKGNTYQLDDNPQNFSLAAPTDFWGEYTLAK
ncbi:hypothetical protein GCM10027049_19570 [Mucilaginibacter puniceus]